MSLDEINLVEASESAKPDKRLSANSIKLREETFDKTKKKYLESRIADLKKELSEMEVDENNMAVSEEKALDKSAAIAKLEGVLKVLSGEEVPTSFIANRAIKLKEEWLEHAKANTAGVSSEVIEEPSEVDITASGEDNPFVAKSDVQDFYDTAFATMEAPKSEEVVEAPVPVSINREEIENEINKKIQELSTQVEETVPTEVPISEVIPNYNAGSSAVSEERPGYIDEVYEPMTDEEIAQAREKLELEQFQRISTDDVVRDEVVVVPERVEEGQTEKEEEIPEFNIVSGETITEEQEKPVEEVESKSIVMSSEEKGQLQEQLKDCSVEELLKVVSDRRKAHEELEEAKNQALREKEESEKKRSEMEAAYAEREEKVKKALLEQISTIDSSNTTLGNDIESVKAETEGTKKDTESIEEKIAKLNEIGMMFGEEEKEEEEVKQKTM